jgi:uncharacterized protein YPO0396
MTIDRNPEDIFISKQTIKKSNIDTTLSFSDKKGESSKASNFYTTGDSSDKKVESYKTYSDTGLNYNDYSWSYSDEESLASKKESVSKPDGNNTDEKKDLSTQIHKSDLERFEKEVINKSSLEELAELMDKLEDHKEEYEISGSNVPAAKTQIALLEEKLRMCAEKIDEKMLDLDTKQEEGKGKEPEGKGKEPEK